MAEFADYREIMPVSDICNIRRVVTSDDTNLLHLFRDITKQTLTGAEGNVEK